MKHTYKLVMDKIDAIQWTGDNLDVIAKFIDAALPNLSDPMIKAHWDAFVENVKSSGLTIATALGGTKALEPLDFIIRNSQGFIYSMKPEGFDSLYQSW